MPTIDDILVKINPAVVLALAIAFPFVLNSFAASAQAISGTTQVIGTDANVPAERLRSDGRIIPADYQTILADVTSGKSKLVVVNMWATWCAPCIEEFPDFVRLARRYDAAKLRVLFVSVDFGEQLPDVEKFLRRQGWEQTSYIKKQKDNEFVTGFGESWTGAVPATFVFDSDGVLLWFIEGKTTFSVLNSVIESNVE